MATRADSLSARPIGLEERDYHLFHDRTAVLTRCRRARYQHRKITFSQEFAGQEARVKQTA